MRIGPNELSIADKAALLPVLGTDGWPKGPRQFLIHKSTFLVPLQILLTLVWSGRDSAKREVPVISVRSVQKHQQRRKDWNLGLSSAALRNYEPLVQERVNILLEELEKRCSDKGENGQIGAVDLAGWMSKAT